MHLTSKHQNIVVHAPIREAIEIKAKLGNTCVVQKLIRHHPTNKKLFTALLTLGAALLLLSAIAFITSLGIVSDNQSRYKEHIQSGRISHEFRPVRVHSLYNWMALGGLVGGIFCISFVLWRKKDYTTPNFRMGTAPGVDLEVLHMPWDDFVLVAPQGNGFVVNLIDGWTGEVQNSENTSSFKELQQKGQLTPSISVVGALELNIPTQGVINLRHGNQELSVRRVAAPMKITSLFLSNLDNRLLSYIATSAICMLGVVFLLDSLYAEKNRLYNDIFTGEERMTHFRIISLEEKIKEKIQGATDEIAGEDLDSGTKMAGEEGTMGATPDLQVTSSIFRRKDKHIPVTLQKSQAIKAAKNSGILGILTARNVQFQSLTSISNFDSGYDTTDLYGNLNDANINKLSGGWGTGIQHIGPGAGGNDWNSIGASDYKRIGQQSNKMGANYKTGSGNGFLSPRHHPKQPRITISQSVSIGGGLDRSIIRRHIRLKLGRISHCYEKQLLVAPNLRGTLVAQFQISPLGVVQGLRVTGINNSPLTKCVQSVIHSIRFPKPQDGAYVNVRKYPFMFQPTGE